MEFKSNRGIFLQIADNLCNQILEGKLLPEERVLSVRELAVELEVNRNTVMRSYAYLQDEGIFENKRGVGFFVSKFAIKKINDREKKDFFENELPFLLKKIELLKLNSEDLTELLKKIKNND
jgi:GntR family transcriptional regulator